MKTTDKYIFFWQNQDIYSQWHKEQFIDEDGNKYCCAEQYMMFQKAMLFKDVETAALIMATNNQKRHKELGRLVKNFDPKIWDENKEQIVSLGNYYKFTQNEDLLNELLSTYPKILVEASPFDKIYGIGMSETDPLAEDEVNWKGLNLLGKILTQLRNDLINEKTLEQNR